MTTATDRPLGCVPPVLLDHVVDDPWDLRALATASGPYFMPARYLIDGASAKDAQDNSRNPKREEVPAHLIARVHRLRRRIVGGPRPRRCRRRRLRRALAATGPAALSSPGRRDQLTARWSGYVAG